MKKVFNYIAPGMAINFESLYNLAKMKGLTENKSDFEIELERLLDTNEVAIKVVQGENRFYKVK